MMVEVGVVKANFPRPSARLRSKGVLQGTRAMDTAHGGDIIRKRSVGPGSLSETRSVSPTLIPCGFFTRVEDGPWNISLKASFSLPELLVMPGL